MISSIYWATHTITKSLKSVERNRHHHALLHRHHRDWTRRHHWVRLWVPRDTNRERPCNSRNNTHCFHARDVVSANWHEHSKRYLGKPCSQSVRDAEESQTQGFGSCQRAVLLDDEAIWSQEWVSSVKHYTHQTTLHDSVLSRVYQYLSHYYVLCLRTKIIPSVAPNIQSQTNLYDKFPYRWSFHHPYLSRSPHAFHIDWYTVISTSDILRWRIRQ